MKRLSTLLLMGCELAAIGCLLVAPYVGPVGNDRRHALFVTGGAFAVLAALMNYGQVRGLFRNFHDAVFEHAPGITLRYIVLLRYPLLSWLLLATYPLIACNWGRLLLDSMFSVRPIDLAFITGLGLLDAWSIMVVLELIVRYGPDRFGGTPFRARPWCRRVWSKTRHIVTATAVVPVVYTAWQRLSNRMEGVFWASVGGLLAFVVLLVTAWQREQVVPSRTPPSTLLWNGAWFRRRKDEEDEESEPEVPGILVGFMRYLGPGYYDFQHHRAQAGHLLALSLLLVILCVYVLIGFAFAPSHGWGDYFPALGYVLLLMMLASWGLPAVSFFFDRWHAPVLLLLLIGTILLYQASHTDHYYLTRPRPPNDQEAVASLSPRQALDAWVEHRPGNAERMTVVALSGGGIAAAAWGAEVLTGLEEALGSRFTQSLQVLSSSSGGSVAAMYYLDGFDPHRPRSPSQLERIRQAARHSSLPAMTWGAAYPDLWRLMFPPAMTWLPYHDRGWALQEAWRSHLTEPQASLYSLRKRIADGQMPVLIFNATVADTGRPFLLTPVDVHLAGPTRFQASLNFIHQYPGQDIDVVTAARLSATFPWVSPICRAPHSAGGPHWHIADGAYFDNYGVVSLVEWLNHILPHYTRIVQKPRVLFLRVTIRPTALTDSHDRQTEGWAYAFYGPLMALLTTGATSQLARNDQLLESLLERWGDRGGVPIEIVDLPLRIEVPLSWQLTPQSISHIHTRWKDEIERGEQWPRIQRFFQE